MMRNIYLNGMNKISQLRCYKFCIITILPRYRNSVAIKITQIRCYKDNVATLQLKTLRLRTQLCFIIKKPRQVGVLNL